MKILHCCLAAYYADNYSYQENILPQMHKQQGHNVAIIASTETYINNINLGYVEPSSYYTAEGIPITRLPYIKWMPRLLVKKLRIYKGLLREIKAFEPDVIFLHDCQFISVKEIALYAKNNPNVRIYVDGHNDFINSARNWLSKNVLHKIIYKHCVKIIEPYTRKFYGVLPLRVEFLKSMYDVPAEKVELLVMGADVSKVEFIHKTKIRSTIRESLNITENDFVIVTGGKIDQRKNIHLLMQAINEINQKNIKLIVFGIANHQMKDKVEELSKHESIRLIGWTPSDKVYDCFLASDVAIFPGTHSVLWEQAVGVGLPCVFKKWEGIQHVDLGGNCILLDDLTVDTLKNTILDITGDAELFKRLKTVAEEKGINTFSYANIAKRAIEQA